MGTLTPALQGLGTLSPIVQAGLPAAFAAEKIVKTAFGENPEQRRREQLRAQQGLALKQLKQQQKTDIRIAEERAALDRDKIAAQAAEADEKRRAALKRAVARQRAQFGGQGLSSLDGGSSEAILLGLFEESETDRLGRERLDNIRLGTIDQSLGAKRRLNVIQRTQLQERQRLERQTGIF